MIIWFIAGLIVWILCILFMLAIFRGGHRIRGQRYNNTGKLDHSKDIVVKMPTAGKPQNSISAQNGADQSTISRFANKYEIRQFIRKVQKN